MIPSTFVVLDALPLTSNGKIDRRALPEPPASRPELDIPFVVPRTLVEETISRIWSEVLEIDQCGVDDNFFDLGGDSLLAGRIVARVNRHFRANITVSDFFESATIEKLSRVINYVRPSEDT